MTVLPGLREQAVMRIGLVVANGFIPVISIGDGVVKSPWVPVNIRHEHDMGKAVKVILGRWMHQEVS